MLQTIFRCIPAKPAQFSLMQSSPCPRFSEGHPTYYRCVFGSLKLWVLSRFFSRVQHRHQGESFFTTAAIFLQSSLTVLSEHSKEEKKADAL